MIPISFNYGMVLTIRTSYFSSSTVHRLVLVVITIQAIVEMNIRQAYGETYRRRSLLGTCIVILYSVNIIQKLKHLKKSIDLN